MCLRECPLVADGGDCRETGRAVAVVKDEYT